VSALGEIDQLVATIVFVVNMWARVCIPGGLAPPQPPQV